MLFTCKHSKYLKWLRLAAPDTLVQRKATDRAFCCVHVGLILAQPQVALPCYASWPLVTVNTPAGPVRCFVEPSKQHLLDPHATGAAASVGVKRGRDEM